MIEPRIWWRTTTARPAMSGSASSHLAMDEASLKNQNQTNLGLINLTSDTSGSFNLIEIATCLFVAISGFYLLSWWCQQRKTRKMQEIRHTLASVRVDPEMSRCPVFEPTQRAISNQLNHRHHRCILACTKQQRNSLGQRSCQNFHEQFAEHNCINNTGEQNKKKKCCLEYFT